MPRYSPPPPQEQAVTAEQRGAVQTRLGAIRDELGTDPAGVHADVRARLDVIDPAGA